ncbi:EscU/YscU/HrcU family type III secretion system export apparatus switch protein [Bacillus sp. CGMCC 1.16607]|uniref:EscU/YscU/HrcU family type III secretion system export apparatus switch protein n=1 Tax=Bacillus sp. CGMCC 1.16607 TaxID=3351842 RepID=UPI003627ED7F
MDNQRKEAIALGYEANLQEAPIVIAKGKGLVADTIIEKAKESGIPIQEDPSLVQLLSQLEINQSIPEELYKVVAEVFAFIYRADQISNKMKD